MTCHWTAPSHYLNQWWSIVNWTFRNKPQWNFNRNSNIFIQENALENVVCDLASSGLGSNVLIYVMTSGRWRRNSYIPSFLQGLHSLSGKTSYRQISWTLEAARLYIIMIESLWNLTDISNFRAIGKVYIKISRLRDFTRSCGGTSARLVNRDPTARKCYRMYEIPVADILTHWGRDKMAAISQTLSNE